MEGVTTTISLRGDQVYNLQMKLAKKDGDIRGIEDTAI